MPMLGDQHPLLTLFDISHKFRETVPGVCQWQFGHSQKYRQIPVIANGMVAAVTSTETDGS